MLLIVAFSARAVEYPDVYVDADPAQTGWGASLSKVTTDLTTTKVGDTSAAAFTFNSPSGVLDFALSATASLRVAGLAMADSVPHAFDDRWLDGLAYT